MVELSLEEKAKRYDIALDKIKRLLGTGSNCSREDLEYIFPELKESEDEKIRKEIIAFLKYYHTGQGKSVIFDENWIAWLEKQEQQKNSTDRFFEGFRQGEQCVIEQPGKYGLQKQGEQILANSAKTCKDEQKPAEWSEPKFKIGDKVHLINGSSPNYEDDCIVIGDISNDTYYGNWEGGYFAIKDQDKYELVEQKPAWSEEDRILQDSSISYLCNLRDTFEAKGWDKEQIQKCINWLKSIRLQSTWKPSDEQMKALYSAASCHVQHDADLCSLYNDLEKLTK